MSLPCLRLLLLVGAITITPKVRADITGDYILQRPSQLVNLNLNAQGSSVAGYFLICSRDDAREGGTKIDRVPVYGSITGSNLRLSATQNVVWTGTVKGSSLKLKWPLENGALQEVTFQRTSTKSWNTKLAAFKRDNAWHAYHWMLARAIQARLEGIARAMRINNLDMEDEQGRIRDSNKMLEDLRKTEQEAKDKVKACEQAVKDQEAEVQRLQDAYAATKSEEAKSRLDDGRSKLADCKSELRDVEGHLRETGTEVKRYEAQVARAEDALKRLSPLHAPLSAEAQFLVTNSLRAYFDRGVALPLKSLKSKGLGIFLGPQPNAEQVYTLSGSEVIYGLPTNGPWYVTLLKNGKLGWIKK